MLKMADFLYIICAVVSFGHINAITVSNSRFNQRLTLTENRLDIVASEISNFRHDIVDIQTNMEQYNASKCPTSVHSNTHKSTTETLQEVKTIQELTKRFHSAFQAEKQARYNFQKAQLEDNRDYQLQMERTMSEINNKATNNRLSLLENKTDALSKHSKSADRQTELEIFILIQQLSDLSIKYENLLEMNKKLQHMVEMLGKCQLDWYPYRRSCYYLSNVTMTWNEALEWCWMNKAQLVEYGDMSEVAFVWSMTTLVDWDSNIWEGYWVGGSDIDEENQFIWSTSNTRVNMGVQYWLPEQPDNDENAEECIMTLVNKFGQWNDEKCSRKLKFVCERQ